MYIYVLGCGPLFKTKFRKAKDSWLLKKKNDEEWYDTGVTAQKRRQLTLQWAGSAWADVGVERYKNARDAWWRKTGCGMAEDNSEDHKVQIEGHKEYKLPPP